MRNLALENFLVNGGNLHQLAGASSEHMRTLYLYACQCHARAELETAEKLLLALMILNGWNFDYAFALGICRQERGAHRDALLCFCHAASVCLSDPRAPFQAGLSLRSLGELDNARRAFRAAQRWSLGRPEYEGILIEATRLLEGV